MKKLRNVLKGRRRVSPEADKLPQLGLLEGLNPTASDRPELASSVTAGIIQTRAEPGQRIYDAAIRSLSEEDQQTIGQLMIQSTVEGIRSAQDAIRAHQHKCDEEKWNIVVKGHTLRLSDAAKSLSLLLDILAGFSYVP